MLKYPGLSKEVVKKTVSSYKKVFSIVNLSYYKDFFNKKFEEDFLKPRIGDAEENEEDEEGEE